MKQARQHIKKNSRREENKKAKILRIKQAAAELFTEKGFDAATTEMIAKRAGVAKGTLFLYARDKRDLVFLIFNDEIVKISNKAFSLARPADPVLEQLISVASGFYRGFAKNAQLSRILLAELFFYRGSLAREFYKDRQQVIENYASLISRAQESGKISREIDASIAGRHFFVLISGCLRMWLAGERPNLEAGLRDLRQILALSLRNVGD